MYSQILGTPRCCQRTFRPSAFLRHSMSGRTSRVSSVRSKMLIDCPCPMRAMTYSDIGSGLSSLDLFEREWKKASSLRMLSAGNAIPGPGGRIWRSDHLSVLIVLMEGRHAMNAVNAGSVRFISVIMNSNKVTLEKLGNANSLSSMVSMCSGSVCCEAISNKNWSVNSSEPCTVWSMKWSAEIPSASFRGTWCVK